MIKRLFAPIVLAAAVASASAQAPVDLKTRLADLKPIEIKPGLTRIPNAEGDGRDAQVFSAWRDNGNAWGYHIFIVTMPQRPQGGAAGTEWSVVGIAQDGGP